MAPLLDGLGFVLFLFAVVAVLVTVIRRFNLKTRIVTQLGLEGDAKSDIEANVEIVRILFGFGMAHRFVDMLGYAPISPNPEEYAITAGFAAALSLCVMLGFMTPIALFLLTLLLLQVAYNFRHVWLKF